VANPVDLLASATAAHYRRSRAAILEDAPIDSVITIFIPPLVTDPVDVAAAVNDAARTAAGKPILGVFMRAEGAPTTLAPIPCYAFPESAALALARVAAYGEWRERPMEAVPTLDRFNRPRIREIVESVLARGGGWASSDEAAAVLSSAGVISAQGRVATDPEAALAAAHDIGFPVALKALGPNLLHKTERQAVILDVATRGQLQTSHDDLTRRLGADMTSVLVQQMIPKGVEMIVGAVHDPLFGPVIGCGTGGVLVDVLADTAFRLHPLTVSDACDMVNDLRGARLLRGYRGAPAADERALRDVLLRVSALVDAAPEIQELDLNPVIVSSSGAIVADARVRIDHPRPTRRGRRVEY
jgi:acyl-CoA synthetase (NDP forming)